MSEIAYRIQSIRSQQYYSSDAKALVGRNIRAARRNEFTFVVSISVKNPRRNPFRDHLCTGTLITKQHVLSAAHCMRCSLVLCRVIVGSTILSEGKRYKIESWINYQQWAQEHNKEVEYIDNDITIITLERRVTEANVEPVVLTTLNDDNLIGSNVVIASWGLGNDGVLCTHLQTVQLRVLTREQCQREIEASEGEEIGPVPHSVICTKANPYALLGGVNINALYSHTFSIT
ncbi:PREDICTED: mite allergen Der f 3-like [Ceratosolen solmsi marchali]|uniref:Mite allergen Der f 3-like n=1 Tax=Ceratosolen solmsi marchali TaxID=326594 RepID=A0AAJ6YHH9_9HYME|nr:PREDICTED: mite allergen Der f 3-like [Ceratosolen solmsi marchali]